MPILGFTVLNYVDRSSPALESEVLIGRSYTSFISPSLAQHIQWALNTYYKKNTCGCPQNTLQGLLSECVMQLDVDSSASSTKGDTIFYLILCLPCLEYHDCSKYILLEKKEMEDTASKKLKLNCLWHPCSLWRYLALWIGVRGLYPLYAPVIPQRAVFPSWSCLIERTMEEKGLISRMLVGLVTRVTASSLPKSTPTYS